MKGQDKEKQVTRQLQSTKGTKMTGKTNKNRNNKLQYNRR